MSAAHGAHAAFLTLINCALWYVSGVSSKDTVHLYCDGTVGQDNTNDDAVEIRLYNAHHDNPVVKVFFLFYHAQHNGALNLLNLIFLLLWCIVASNAS